MDGGGTTTWLGRANKGLFEPAEIQWGGWGGRFSWTDEQSEGYTFTQFSGVSGTVEYGIPDFAPLWRWRDAYTRDFQARMDWCVAGYGQANHHPVAVFMGDRRRTVCRLRARAGEEFDLDASQSFDPDGDALDYAWYTYPEAGTYKDPPAATGSTEATARFAVPSDAVGTQLHVVLEVTDRSAICPVTSYRWIVIDVTD